jgi:hypothetical protein
MQDYIQLDQLLHLISQPIAKINRSLQTQQADDSHTNLYFDPIGSRLLSRSFKAGDKAYWACFHLPSWEYQLLDSNMDLVAHIPVHDKSFEDLERDWLSVIGPLGIEQKGLMRDLHFEIRNYSFKSEPIQVPDSEAVHTWIAYRAFANQALSEVIGSLQSDTQVRIWPHHFDTGIYCEFQKKLGLGMGWAMADELVDEPYFYLSFYPLKGAELDESKPYQCGKWLDRENWKGFVLKASELGSRENAQTTWWKNFRGYTREGLAYGLRSIS